MKRYIVSLFFLMSVVIVFAQDKPDIKFIKHLTEKEYFKEALYVIDNSNYNLESKSFRDSLYYYKGSAHYSLKQLEESAASFIKVSKESVFYDKSTFFAAYGYTHIGDYQSARNHFNTYISPSDILRSLKKFQLAGISLLSRDYFAFDTYISKVDTSYYNIRKESAKLKSYCDEMRTHRAKSPFWAAVFSAIIPGTGKIYAGKTGAGISALLTVGGLGMVTWENYNKRGLNDYRTIILGSVFSVFYIGNIYGSYVSVKINEQEYVQEYNNKILFNIHIPLRNIFN